MLFPVISKIQGWQLCLSLCGRPDQLWSMFLCGVCFLQKWKRMFRLELNSYQLEGEIQFVIFFFFTKKHFLMINSTYFGLWTLIFVWKWKVKIIQSCLTLCDLMDYSVHGILQVRILERLVILFSRGSSQPRPGIKPRSHIVGGFFYQLSHQGSPNICVVNIKVSIQNSSITYPKFLY